MKTDKGEMAKSSVRMESTHKNEADAACGAAAAVKCEEFRGPIDCCKGRLLLRSLKIPTAPKQSPQVEVFLELSVGDWCLGRVFLRLWTHLRRAQHFLALCLGCYGYTFMGASASTVLNKGSPREALVFYDCMKNNTQGSDQGIINGLEWGGQYQGSVKEGVVTGCTHRNGHNNASSFAITTVSQAGGKYECPFGEITSGLAIIKAAVISDPVTKVKITNCGMVVPDVTQ